MAARFISPRNLKFLLYEVLDAAALTEHPRFQAHNRKSFDLVLDAAMKLSTRLLRPVAEEMDQHPPTLRDGAVQVHPAVAGMIREFGRGGWIGATFPESVDGEGLPMTVSSACYAAFCAANYSASVYPGLTSGAARLILSFGDEALRRTYLPRMLTGDWQGTMALTEPQAGSALGDLTTAAYPTSDGRYRIKGQKSFISAGDLDAVENVVHLMLARIDGAPPGTKGISLFVVPKLRPEGDGLRPNDITVSQIYHKLGFRGAPLTELAIGDRDDCIGHLVGEPNRGLPQMFQMMNEERVGVGMGAAGIASAAYYAALDYCKGRTQGRRVTDKDPTSPPIPIIEHADVKRMLLFQKAVTEGSIALLLQCSLYEDLKGTATDEDAADYALLLDLLTPVAKTYPAEMGILSVSAAIQCLGGYGYCEDFPVAQYFRDMRIHTIHEGTTGIQGMDLLGRKVIIQEGRAFSLYAKTVAEAVEAAEAVPDLAPLAERLRTAMGTLESVTRHLVGVAGKRGPEVFLADATLYLELFGITVIAWQWLRQAIAARRGRDRGVSGTEADFYAGKEMAARYFFAYELPKIDGLARRLTDGDPLTIEMTTRWFAD